MCLNSRGARIIEPIDAMEDKPPLTITSNQQFSSVEHANHVVVIVAPQWLQDGLAVVIKSIPGVRLVACTSTIHILLSLDLDRPPDLVVLAVDAQNAKAKDQFRQVKFGYHHARCLALIQESAQSASVRAAGADETLLQGASAEQFCAAVRRLLKSEEAE